MATAEELLVAIRSEGVDETRQDLEGVESAMEDTAESAGDSAAELEGFSERFSGAMSAAVAALAIGAAGLLAQVPVLGEAFSGLAAIVGALAFQMDGVLRPVLTPLTNGFFEVANMIYEADGATGALIGGFTTITALLATAIPLIAKAGVVMGTWSSTLGGISAILGTVVSWIQVGASALVGFVSGSLTLAATLGALLGVLGVTALEMTGVLDIVRNLGAWIGNELPASVRDGFTTIVGLTGGILVGTVGGMITGFVSGYLEGGLSEGINRAVSNAQKVLDIFARAWGNSIDNVMGFIADFTSDLLDWASGLAEDAYTWGVDFIKGFLNGVLSFAGDVVQAVEDVINGILDVINATIAELPKKLKQKLELEQFAKINAATDIAPQRATSEELQRRENTRMVRGRRGVGANGTVIDGRQLSESTGRYRSDPGRRRGL